MLFPTFLKLNGRRVLLVGGGPVAASKLRALLDAGASVRVVAPTILLDIASAPVETIMRPFQPSDLDDVCFVVAAAQSGIHDSNRETYGDTLIADYWGRVLSREPRGSAVITAALDKEGQRATRESFPALRHRVMA
jgi:hypothetical protein